MRVTAKQIAEGVQAEVLGNAKVEVSGIAKIEEGKSDTICFLANEKYLPYLQNTEAGIVLISKSLVPNHEVKPTLLIVDDAQKSFVQLLEFYNQFRVPSPGIDTQASIADSSSIGEEVYIGAFTIISNQVKIGDRTRIYPNVFIGDQVEIGNDVTIEPNVVIFNDAKIGHNVVIHSGSVIGSDGFGFSPESTGYRKVPQLGNVIIEDDVEIGSNCTIDRATMGSTIIKKGAKLDNLIQIAHNVQVGSHTVIAAQAGIAGSTKIGEWNMIGGQVGIVGHITLGNQIQIQAQSGVNKNVKDGAKLYGSPALDAQEFRKSYVYFKNLKNLVDQIHSLEKEVEILKSERK